MKQTRFNNRRKNARNGDANRNNRNGQSKANLHRALEKYLTSARDAGRGGDRIAAEGFYQHAEHYQRLLNKLGGDEPKPAEPKSESKPEPKPEPQPAQTTQ